MQEIIEIKLRLHQLCIDLVTERLNTAQTALEHAREASNDDTKSSAGDKYETGRELIQQEIDRNAKLLLDARDNLKTLGLIEALWVQGSRTNHTVAHNGRLVVTDNGYFYIAVSMGQLKVPEEIETKSKHIFDVKPVFFAVSATSPIGKQFLGKNEGSVIQINGNSYRILGVF